MDTEEHTPRWERVRELAKTHKHKNGKPNYSQIAKLEDMSSSGVRYILDDESRKRSKTRKKMTRQSPAHKAKRHGKTLSGSL